MAEVVLNFILARLRDQLKDDVLYRPAAEAIMKIGKALGEIKGFLDDADWRRRDDDVDAWIRKVRALAFRVEDEVDGYRTRRVVLTPFLLFIVQELVLLPFLFVELIYPLSLLLMLVPTLFDFLNSFEGRLNRIRLLRNLKAITKDIDDVLEEMEKYDFVLKKNSTPTSDAATDSSANMIRMKSYADRMRELLLEEAFQECRVIFIMGGTRIGKIILAFSVYEETKTHFDCHAWVFLNHPFQKKETFREIIQGLYNSCSDPVPNNLYAMDEQELCNQLSSYLNGKRFLLLLNDVRDLQNWSELDTALPLQPNGSKIMLTTVARVLCNIMATQEEEDAGDSTHRSSSGNLPDRDSSEDITGPSDQPSNIHMAVRHKSVYELNLTELSDEDLTRLLRSEVLPGGEELPHDLKNIQKEILNKCQGLPISIATVGILLSAEGNKPEEWNKFLDELPRYQFPGFPEHDWFISSAYAELSPILKQCFLYCGIFPDNYTISKKRLVRMWVAEGFVDKIRGLTEEVAAKRQLDKLVGRNMLQVVKKDLNGEVESCQMLNRMREFARNISREINFFTIGCDPRKWEDLRRFSIEDAGTFFNPKFRTARRLRSLLFFGTIDNQNQLSTSKGSLRLTFKMLRVLELQGLHIKALPSEVGDLILLRYLGLRRSGLVALPKSLERLTQLETLDIRQTNIQVLPDMYYFKKLRHLLIENSSTDGNSSKMSLPYVEGRERGRHSSVNSILAGCPKLDISFASLSKCIAPTMQTHFPVDGEIDLSRGLMWLTELQTLAGAKVTKELCTQLRHLTQLRKLSLRKAKGEYATELYNSLGKMSCLYSLSIKCDSEEELNLEGMPLCPHLNKLKLGGHMENLLKWVSSLQSLCYLYLSDSFLSDDPLTKLKHLEKLVLISLYNAYDGIEMSSDEDGFPSLKKLSIIHLRRLQSVNIMNGGMPKLEHLFLAQCPKLDEPPEGIQHLKHLKIMEVKEMPSGFEGKAMEKSTQGEGFKVQVIRQIISD